MSFPTCTGNILDAMTRGIDQSDTIIVFVTNNYLAKVASGKDEDNVRREFMYAQETRGASRMIAVRFDPALPVKWKGPVGMVLGSNLYVDMSRDPILQSGVASLAKMIKQQQHDQLQATPLRQKLKSAGRAAMFFRNAQRPGSNNEPERESVQKRQVGNVRGSAAQLRERVKKVADALDLEAEHMHLAEIIARAENTLCMQQSLSMSSALFCKRLAKVEAQLGLVVA
jgi:hypothetical protein